MPVSNLRTLALSLGISLLMSTAAHAQVWEKLKLPERPRGGPCTASTSWMPSRDGSSATRPCAWPRAMAVPTWDTVTTGSGADCAASASAMPRTAGSAASSTPRGQSCLVAISSPAKAGRGHPVRCLQPPMAAKPGSRCGCRRISIFHRWKWPRSPCCKWLPAAARIILTATWSSTDGGKTWKLISCHRALFDMRMINDKRWVAVGFGDPNAPRPASKDMGDFYKNKSCRAFFSDDGGATWKASKGSEGKGCLRSWAVAKKQALLTVGDNGAIFRSPDDGTTWETVKSPTTEDLRSVTWCGSLAVALGKKGTVIVSKDDGKSWNDRARRADPRCFPWPRRIPMFLPSARWAPYFGPKWPNWQIPRK